MDEQIKPVAWYCTESNDGKYKFRDPFLSTNAAYVEAHKGYDWATLYDQQAIDTLRAEVERQKELISDLNSIISGIPAELRRASQAKQELSDFLIARAERAEAEAEALRKDAERYRWLRLALLGAENDPIDHLLLEKEPETDAEFDAAVDAAIDAAKQGAE